jgi:hypothetical protein
MVWAFPVTMLLDKGMKPFQSIVGDFYQFPSISFTIPGFYCIENKSAGEGMIRFS